MAAAMRAAFIVISALTLFGAASVAPARAWAEEFRIIVHPSNPVTTVQRAFLTDVFLKKATKWPDGQTIRPVDQTRDSGVRSKFSDSVLGRTVFAVKSYWQQVIFSGRGLPPPELESDEAVIKYVIDHAGAVGYVSETADVGEAKLLTVR